MTTAVRMSHVEFDIVWERLGLGERPYPITVPVFGATTDERAVLREQVWQSLADRGLHDGTDLRPRLEDLLVLLVRNRFTIDGLLSGREQQRILAAAGRGDAGLLLVQTDAEVRLEPVRGGDVVAAVMALVAEEKPGPGDPIGLPTALFDEAVRAYASGGHLALETALRAGGITGRELRGLSTLLESARSGGGQLAANTVDRMGRRTRTPVLNWFDTEAGRYLVFAERRRDGAEWLTCAPGDSGRLSRRLTELVAGLRV
ncbi:MAG TPA: ESX secretion-associated protein EspG [Actinophytocola sp.]|uniref:ESX secretion-associated protein EspG n=1 Tax=Actinophytocola sp. TaxID=1872138 RepID=UPI002DC05065|nr:ESX secretion-associated protein EspG [Actinophytocola sp.]HEU5473293.1 ESX secretion-associated protein EspG [Actinophytocola sp.]